MNTGRFAVSVHILTLLAKAEGKWTSSAFLAGSININPVLVRKEISNLVGNGLITSREGKNGGCTLAKPASTIKMADVYQAVRQPLLLGLTRNEPNPRCPVGRQINKHLEDLYADAEQAMITKLGKVTLAGFISNFK